MLPDDDFLSLVLVLLCLYMLEEMATREFNNYANLIMVAKNKCI